MTIEAFAPAKINLTLHVTGQRADGYHLLDSLVAFADVGDRLWLTGGPEMSMTVTGPFSEGVPADRRNLAWRAAELAGWTGHITLEKNLPHGAGIGGGSSDAAAVLRALGYGDSGLELGADVPVCKRGKAARMQGIGEQLSAVPDLPPLHALLVNPGVQVPTPDVFAALHSKTLPAMTDIPERPDRFVTWLKAQRNDLEIPALGIAPVIEQALTDLNSTAQVQLARMSGSGATCFALYPHQDAAEHAAFEMHEAHPDWWVMPTALS